MCNLMMSKHGLLKSIRNWYPLQNHSGCKRRETTFDYIKSVLSSITPTFQSIVELQTENGSKYITAFWYFTEDTPAQLMIVNPPPKDSDDCWRSIVEALPRTKNKQETADGRPVSIALEKGRAADGSRRAPPAPEL